MTIAKSKQRKDKANLLLVPILLIILGGAFFSISLYNKIVDLKHKLTGLENELYDLEVGNAELKNNLFSLLDVNNMQNLISENGLILEKNPSYLEFKTNELASNMQKDEN